MKILRTEKLWIHTHFLTDCQYLPREAERDIRKEMSRALEKECIVFGIHFESRPDERGLRIVLECLPFPQTLERLQRELARIIQPLPSRPRQTKVDIAAPQRKKG